MVDSMKNILQRQEPTQIMINFNLVAICNSTTSHSSIANGLHTC